MTSKKLTKTQLLAVNRQLTAEIAARKQDEDRYRLLVESIDDMICEVNREGIFTYVSPSARQLLGYSAEELIGRSAFELMSPEEVARHRALFHTQLVVGQPLQGVEVTTVRKDGRLAVHEANLSPVFAADGTCSGFRGVIRDITDRKGMEESLRQNHQELQTIYDGMADGLLIADVHSLEFLRANQAMCRMLGYSEQELVRLSVRDLHPPEELSHVISRFAALASGELMVAADVPVLRKDGSVFYADISRNALQYHGRDCLVGFFRDNTERKKVAEALRHEHQVLRQLLKSHDRDRQLIAYEIHDGVAQLLAAAIMQFDTYQRMRCDTPITATRGGNVVAELLRQCHAEVRRLIGGLRPPVLDAFGVVAALQHLVYESMARWENDIQFRHQVTFDRLEPSLENAIYRIAQEGLSNACQHSHSDKVLMELAQHGETVRISVQDWGTGFDPSSAGEKCFGLAGIRERARLLGGHVSIATRPGEGSHVVVELPIVIN